MPCGLSKQEHLGKGELSVVLQVGANRAGRKGLGVGKVKFFS